MIALFPFLSLNAPSYVLILTPALSRVGLRAPDFKQSLHNRYSVPLRIQTHSKTDTLGG